jgi:hypothetical protein
VNKKITTLPIPLAVRARVAHSHSTYFEFQHSETTTHGNPSTDKMEKEM